MYNLLLDSDALIKLAHSELLSKLCKLFNCFITKEVRAEVVTEGKKRFYPGADVIESLINDKLLKIKEPESITKIKENFGKGEKSILDLYNNTKNGIIVSDDFKFIKYLEREGILFFVPSDAIILLKQLRIIDIREALYFLDKLRTFIRDEVYNETKKEIMED